VGKWIFLFFYLIYLFNPVKSHSLTLVGNKNNNPLTLLLIGSFLIVLAEFIKKIQKQPVKNKKDLSHLPNRKNRHK
jgi:hypothetical protein